MSDTPIDAPIDAAEFRQVLGHYPTGVAAITTIDTSGAALALVVGSFTSVSLDPPLVGFLPDKRSSSWPLIEATGKFAVNILASDQTALCRQLAGKGPDKFAGIEYTTSANGLPLLAGAIATIECRLADVVEAGDHYFVMGQVVALEIQRAGDPMLFYRGTYGGFAPPA